MKITALITIIGLLYSHFCQYKEEEKYANNNTFITKLFHPSIDTIQIIKMNKKNYIEINNDINTYIMEEKKMYDESSEGTIFNAYYSNKVLKKLSGTYYRETGKTLIEYFFNGNDFFYVYSKDLIYINPLSINRSGKIKKVVEYKYYFYNGELLRMTIADKIISAGSNMFLEQNKFFKRDFKKFKNIFMKK